jgi:ATP-dependent DNA ligase
MLARPDSLPRGDCSYELTWDGFRAIVATEDGVQVRSRRGSVLHGRWWEPSDARRRLTSPEPTHTPTRQKESV